MALFVISRKLRRQSGQPDLFEAPHVSQHWHGFSALSGSYKDSYMPAINREQIDAALRNLNGWSSTSKAIRREFGFPDFTAAMDFVNRVAQLAEAANHHPDIDIRYNKVVLALWSHDLGAVTERDLRLAREIDNL
jgi:4a-hydroxytetrahydrobiopterin dehydratase